MADTLFVFAEIQPRPRYFAEAYAAVAGIVEATREEPGCLDFRLLKEGAGERFYLYEEWEDGDALAAHYDMPYTQEVFTAYEGWLACPPIVRKLYAAP